MLVDLTISLLEENKHLKADKEALIAGQETLQKYLAIIEANGISVEKYKDSINCLEKACDELKAALEKKDDELKAVRHYYNECLKDLKKAHAEIERLKEQLNSKYKWENMLGKKIKEVKAEAIKELNARIYAYKTGIFIKGEELIIIPRSDYNEILKEMVGDTEC
jgi:chromosome segregation ATPase